MIEEEDLRRFKIWKTKHAKKYLTKEEDVRRFEIWKTNLALVESHNQEAAKGVHGYTMAINEFSDLSDKEFEIKMHRYVDSGEASDNEETENFQVILVQENAQ